MKPARLIPVLVLTFLAGCRGCTDQSEKRETTDSITTNKITDSIGQGTPSAVTEPGTDTSIGSGSNPEVQQPGTGTVPRNTEPPAKNREPDLTRNVSQYIISSPKFSAGSNGISQATVTVKNTHPSISYQKVILEVTITGANDFMRSNLFTVVNLGPGESKQVTVPDSPQGSNMTSKIVKFTQATE